MQKSNEEKVLRKPQHQNRPGREFKMKPAPLYDDKKANSSGKLRGKCALITGGDSGIGRAVAVLFAKEGADVVIAYYNEHMDAEETKKTIEEYGQKCLLISGDLKKEQFCKSVVSKTIKNLGQLDILVNNASVQYERKTLNEISTKQLLETFQSNLFSMFWITKNALNHMRAGSAIINTTSVTAYRGSAHLIDYSATKGAIVSFTRSLSANLANKKIRVNAVAPGPIWTPLIVSSFKASKVSTFGSDVPMKRAGEPVEIAPCYLFLACENSSYMTGQVLHPNGGEIING
ncbi:MAG: SDR family oxidoreductase [Bacteroidetes bacterium]|nr:SDR family oxidoreductase [Bacteroidota bacterium]